MLKRNSNGYRSNYNEIILVTIYNYDYQYGYGKNEDEKLQFTLSFHFKI